MYLIDTVILRVTKISMQLKRDQYEFNINKIHLQKLEHVLNDAFIFDNSFTIFLKNKT